MGKHKKFNKKEAVKFELIPGKDENGNPTVMFKPVETRNKLSEKQRNKIIEEISDYQIEIDGKMVNESDIPSYVLEQIKGRADLIFNQKNPDMWENEDDSEDMEEGDDIEYDEEWDEDEEGELIPEEEYMGYEDEENMMKCVNKKEKEMEEKGEAAEVTIDGESYKLTEKQKKLLEVVLPENYDNYEIQGVEFIKYDDDGIRVDEKDKSGKYIASAKEKRAVLDSYDFIPDKHVNIMDNDLEGEVLKGDMKDLDEALNFDGDEEAYEEMEDDFFSKLIEGNADKKEVKKEPSTNQVFKKKQGQIHTAKVENKSMEPIKAPIHKQQPQKQQQEDDFEDEDYEDCEEEITDEMLDKALEEYDRKGSIDSTYSESGRRIDGTGIPFEMKGSGMEMIKFIEGRDGCTGKDGELDWRTLTKKEKREYMKNKQIREIIDEVREREITEKLKGKQNVTAEELHLKQYISHIPYESDHVMQESIKRCQEEIVNIETMENDEDYSTDSEEDDIVSYRAKTSIISSNLATVEEVSSKKNKNKEEKEVEEVRNVEKVKVILEKRNKNETEEERKERKEKLKQLKKLKKEQKKEFGEIFEGERRKVMKRDNGINTNPLHKVAYVKMH